MSNKEKIQQKYNHDIERLHSELNKLMKSTTLPDCYITGGGAGNDSVKIEGIEHSYPYADIECKYNGLFYGIKIKPMLYDYVKGEGDIKE